MCRVSMAPFYPFIRSVPYLIRQVWVRFFFVNLSDTGMGKYFFSLSKRVRVQVKPISYPLSDRVIIKKIIYIIYLNEH